mgnify:CR=1 FL=1
MKKTASVIGSFLLLCVAYPADFIAKLCQQGLDYLNPNNQHNFDATKKSPIAATGSSITSQVQIGGEFGVIHLDGYFDKDDATQKMLDKTLVEVVKAARVTHEQAVQAAEAANQDRSAVFAELKGSDSDVLTIQTAATGRIPVSEPPQMEGEPGSGKPPASLAAHEATKSAGPSIPTTENAS